MRQIGFFKTFLEVKFAKRTRKNVTEAQGRSLDLARYSVQPRNESNQREARRSGAEQAERGAVAGRRTSQTLRGRSEAENESGVNER